VPECKRTLEICKAQGDPCARGEQRSRRIAAVVNIMRNTRDVLTGVHLDEMKALGAWGFDVFDTRTTPPKEDEDES